MCFSRKESLGISYTDKNFDPEHIKRNLGLNDNSPIDISKILGEKEEFLRLANLLHRTKNLSRKERKKLELIKRRTRIT